MLDIVDTGEPEGEQVEEIGLIRWEGFACEDFQEVAEVITAIRPQLSIGAGKGA